jgi:ElaB/YqjD/DUF883 family membrane-anchored ribosome-binding protein
MEGTKNAEKAVDRTRRQAMGFIDKASSMGEDIVESVQDKGEEYWQKAKDTGQDILDEVNSRGQQGLKLVRSYVRTKPFQAVGIAVACGLILGFLWAPKKSVVK